MASDIWSLVLNVVASFIYAGIMYLWGMRGGRPISEPISNQNNTAVDAIELAEPVDSMGTGRRLSARKNADETAYKFVFYLMTFGMLYLSISTPPVFKALFSNGEVFLSSARFIGEYLPAIPVEKTTLQVTFFLISALLYLPLLLVSEFVSGLIRPLFDSFKEVTERIFLAITMLVSVVLCIPLAAASVWLYFDKTYTDSLLSVLFFTAIPFIFLQAQSERR